MDDSCVTHLSGVQRCAEAEAAAAQLKEQAEAASEEGVRIMLQQLVGHLVTQKDKAHHAAAKVIMRGPCSCYFHFDSFH